MTLPAHRYLHRVEAVEERKKDDGDKQKTWVFDLDETITKAPDQCARMSKALREIGDKVVVVTGNQSPRDDLKKQLDDYGFKYDDLIQYQDDQTDGLNRAAVLKQLDAFCGFDDRAGRGYTLAKVCPHFFLVAKPPKRAKDNAEGFKAKKVAKRSEERSAAPPPPNYRPMDTAGECCGACVMFDEGVCWGYGNAPVDADHVCDSFAPHE